jgi:Holliday junction resolvasome RuvABC endonuclease subunit
MFIVAVDPGTRFLGVAFFHDGRFLDAQTLRNPASRHRDVDQRCFDLVQELARTTRQFQEDRGIQETPVVVYEDPEFRSTEATTQAVQALYRFCGHLSQWAMARGYRVHRYKVGDVKLGVAGSRRATKDAVEGVLKHEYNLHDAYYSDHAWDAMSVGGYHLAQLRIQAAGGG